MKKLKPLLPHGYELEKIIYVHGMPVWVLRKVQP